MVKDAGEWKCEMESYHGGYYRGYGYNATGVMKIEVPTTTTTTTATTTTTTQKTTTNQLSQITNGGAVESNNSGEHI